MKVSFALSLLVLFIAFASADELNNPSGTRLFSYYESDIIENTYSGGDEGASGNIIAGIHFQNFETLDKIYYIKSDFAATFSHDDGDILSDQSSFTITCGGHVVATGTAVLTFSTGVLYMYFDGDIAHHGLTGVQYCDVSGLMPDNARLVCGSCRNTNPSGLHQCQVLKLAATQAYDVTTKVVYGEYWQNVINWETKNYYGNEFVEVDVLRVIGGTVYSSDAYIESVGDGLYSDTSNSNWSATMFSKPIEVRVKDPLPLWHNITLFAGAAPTDYIFGYVRDAENGFLLSDVVVNLTHMSSDYTFVTGADGKYVFPELFFEGSTGTLNASRENYENYTEEITLVNGGRYDISLVGNVTVYDGTASVYGFVRDYDDYSLISGALVAIDGNGSGFSMMSNPQGYFCFYNVTGTGTHVLVGRKTGYESGSSEVNVGSLDAKYPVVVYLLNQSSVSATPTPTPTGPPNPIEILLNALGLGEFFDWIMALIIIMILAGTMAYLTHGSALATGIGALFGFLISCFAGFLPMWLLGIAIMGACAFFAMMVMKGR